MTQIISKPFDSTHKPLISAFRINPIGMRVGSSTRRFLVILVITARPLPITRNTDILSVFTQSLGRPDGTFYELTLWGGLVHAGKCLWIGAECVSDFSGTVGEEVTADEREIRQEFADF